jgi:hypothetical protein
MRRTTLAYFLMLLLASAALDDVCAAATADTSDDEAAAENDEYLPSAFRQDTKPSGENDLPLPPLLNAADGGPCAAHARGMPATSQPGPLAGPSLLYVFMSLRR